MNGQLEHGILPQATHDELARQNFVQSLKIYWPAKSLPVIRLSTKNVSNLRSSASMGDRLEIDVMFGR
jgi:hypothetical protein